MIFKKRALLSILGAAVLAIPMLCRSQEASKPVFEVASIKPNRSGVGSAFNGSPNRLVATALSLSFLIREAYGVRDFQLVGGPDWINTDRWDIEAKATEGAISTPAASMDMMLQSLLEDRFQLKVHREMKELPVYDVTVARGGLKMKLSPDQSPPVRGTGKDGPPRPGEVRRGGMRMGSGEIEASAWTVHNFINLLSRQMDRTLVDKTDVQGFYDIKLEWTPDLSGSPPAGSEPPSIFTALQEQLGLKLESAKGLVEVLMIEDARKPAEN